MSLWDSCCIREMRSDDLELVLEWRNHPDVRRYMLTQHEITMQEHRAWFERSCKDEARRQLIVMEREVPLGFVSFVGVNLRGIADWGFYTVPNSKKGTGRKLGSIALNYGFVELGLHKICGQAISYNQASRRFHAALGFYEEGVLREHCCVNESYYDLICFGLLAQEWNATNAK